MAKSRSQPVNLHGARPLMNLLSLANFYCQYTARHEFIIYATRQQVRSDNTTICYRRKQIDVSFTGVCPVIDDKFRRYGSTQVLPRGATATLTM